MRPEGEPRRLAGMAALVTGAAGGIGLAVARRLAQDGCRVLLTDIDAARLDRAVASLAGEGAETASEAADLADPAARDRLAPALLARWGRIDILVNNAADHGARLPFMETTDAEWERVLAINVTAAASLSRAAAKDMLSRRSGAIVNIGSIQADMPVRTYAAYVASKGAVAALTRALAAELSPSGIRVNMVAPGVIATDRFEATLAAGGQGAKGGAPLTAALLGRQGDATDVAAAVAFLASPEASFITGATLDVDGGRSISRRPDPFEIAFGATIQSDRTLL